ncbi:hypothetical protein METUNv1_01585 [Methyloversatilis universalis FAM5]|uniref:Uncharacterized protein n=1 Tax=Methyloversatilis universalis (strain ATCC BAA-1314 / DSM 25237 / JCM 13912 / CCUG 52030 / FAM5) TaxID=1000565 RepID=F5RBE2_METUF|nr:hypothetical protein [Methyloversatilis universalis]EGK72113.1 hypothetical protein METUNv1_01585 [Methyloversatilis universalis FAM5]
MPYDYTEKSLDIQERLMRFGLQSNHLMLIGAFITAYGLFENTLERALWALSERDIEGVRPFTETMNTEAQFKMLGEGNPKLSDKCNAVLKVAAHAAEDLNEYRNSLVHGYLLSFGPDSVPSFMKNPRWHGATGRKKAVGDAYIDEPIQDLVLIAAWNLFALVRKVEKVFTDPDAQQAIEAMKDDVGRAKSYAGEARHLRALMNHEKY